MIRVFRLSFLALGWFSNNVSGHSGVVLDVIQMCIRVVREALRRHYS